jgi:protease IV
MRRFFRWVGRVFAVIGFLGVASVVVFAVLLAGFKPKIAPLPGAIVLQLDLTKGLSDGPGEPRWRQVVFGGQPTLRDVLDGIARGAGDPRVKGLYARLGDDDIGLATVEELRDAIAAFRAKGKFAIAFADTFGELGPGTRPYFLAAAFDQIWLQPMGMLGLTGLDARVPFVKGLLDLIGITPDFDHREEYKTAMNTLTETALTPPHREEIEGLVTSMSGQVVHGIAADRKLSEAAVRTDIDGGPLLGQEAVADKLIDHIGYRDMAIADARKRAGAGSRLVNIDSYLDRAGHPDRSGAEIALIYGSGLIQRGSDSESLLAGSDVMAAEKLAEAFRKAADDKDVRAILFRINSPGGSVVASETIWRAVAEARQKGKPVIVSMGEVAGSGGYFVAAPANKIVAEPATLTGSIGVLAGKIVIGGLLKKLGIAVDGVATGANASMFDPTTAFSPPEHQRLETFLDAIYAGFKAHVAEGRHLTSDQVEAVAKGRVWTGEEAKAKGLVDALGGYQVALQLAKEAAHIAPAAPVDLKVFPPEKNPAELIYERLTHENEGDSAGAGALGAGIPGAPALLSRVAAALFQDPMVLMMPAIGPVR